MMMHDVWPCSGRIDCEQEKEVLLSQDRGPGTKMEHFYVWMSWVAESMDAM